MELHNLLFFARICEQNAAVARMQAENAVWAARGQEPAYVDGHFLECEQELRGIVNEMEEYKRMGL